MNRSHPQSGFTLIETLVVIVIAGILSAIAIPTYLNQANKAREAEALLNVGAIAREQQTFFNLNGRFAGLNELDTRPDDSANFRYQVQLSGNGEASVAENRAIPLTGLRGAIALNSVRIAGEDRQPSAAMLLCQGEGGRSGEVRWVEDTGYECAESGAVPVVPPTEAEQ